jgi:aspartate aminotransferase
LSPDAFARTIVINAVSKTYAMTGWRIGYCASADPALIAAINRLQDHTQSNPCSIAQYAALEALRGDQASVEQMCRVFQKRRDRMLHHIQGISALSCRPAQGAFYCFPRYKVALDSNELAQRVLDEAHVVVVPGSSFGMEGYMRLSYAVDDATLDKGMHRLREWFSRM